MIPASTRSSTFGAADEIIGALHARFGGCGWHARVLAAALSLQQCPSLVPCGELVGASTGSGPETPRRPALPPLFLTPVYRAPSPPRRRQQHPGPWRSAASRLVSFSLRKRSDTGCIPPSPVFWRKPCGSPADPWYPVPSWSVAVVLARPPRMYKGNYTHTELQFEVHVQCNTQK